ncbi:M42 family metallopeptidase [Aliifodinibius sp. S!AR15-10]|uniref:M42 family metallopeptidase n=1 Tax=Aliifodinibius sp. S!AR15-10 TaxID=2950437 RepID=UPI00286372B6|nr:M42 family metallopeptidase [Aliifodinibius sp. S!AR15-10]MDR8390364.1 M42 family metallopeptidase [Aliifodinibius sp. S!AR15-10]
MYDTPEYDFLEKLLVTPSPTGFESAGQQVWTEYVDDFADEVETDTYGSAVAKLNTSFDVVTVMLEAHCDEIGMIVQHITEDGFIYLNKLGGSDSTIARAKRVFIHARDGVVSGVVGNTAIHLQNKKNGGGKQPAWKDIYVDIGASSREEALKMVQVGDPVTYSDDFEFLSDQILTGRALDNRIGGYMVAQALRKLNDRRDELNVNVMALNSVQEEVGGYGARMMSFRHQPDLALVTDVTHATDSPGINNKEHGLVKLGKGPVLQHGGANHPKVVEFLEQVAKEHEFEIQHEANSVRTGTDTDSIFYQKTGIASALISLPLRYMHSPVETASIKDVNKLIDLMVESVLSLAPDQTFTAL